MLLVKIKLLLMCDSKVLLTYLNLADVPTYQNVHVLYLFSHIGQDLCAPHTFNLTVIIPLCRDCDCDPLQQL